MVLVGAAVVVVVVVEWCVLNDVGGFVVLQAASNEQIGTATRTHDPNLILGLPNTDIYSLLRLRSGDDRYRTRPFVPESSATGKC